MNIISVLFFAENIIKTLKKYIILMRLFRRNAFYFTDLFVCLSQGVFSSNGIIIQGGRISEHNLKIIIIDKLK